MDAAVESLITMVGDGVADFFYAAAVASAGRAEKDLGADADFSKDLIHAQADFNDDVAAAYVTLATHYAAAEKTRFLADYSLLAEVAYLLVTASAEAGYDLALKNARITRAGKVGDALVTLATKLGSNLVGQAQEVGDAGTALTQTENTAATNFVTSAGSANQLLTSQAWDAQLAYAGNQAGADNTRAAAEGAANVLVEVDTGAAVATAVNQTADAEAEFHRQAAQRKQTQLAAQAGVAWAPSPGSSTVGRIPLWRSSFKRRRLAPRLAVRPVAC